MKMWNPCLAISFFVGSLAAFSLNPSDPRSLTARVFDSQLSDLYEFIGDDDGFNFLKEDTQILDPGRNPHQEAELKLLIQNFAKPEMKQILYEMPFQTLEQELENLNDKLEALYQRLYNFAVILVSLSDEDFLNMAEKLDQNQDYYKQVMNNEIDALSLFENWTPRKSYEEDYQLSSLALGSSYKEVSGLFVDADGTSYWNPDADYEMVQETFLQQKSSNSTLDESFHTTGIIKIIKSILMDIKLFFTVILKLIKLAKLLKLAEVKICLKIMGTIEKIVKCLNLIKSFLIKKIKSCIKKFPWNVIEKIKRVVRLILKIITAILWEIKKISTEILIKLYYLLRRVERWARIPIEIKIYIKQEIYERLGYADEDRERYLGKLLEEHEEELEREKSEEFKYLEPIDEDGLSYAIGSGYKPDELDKLFTKSFTKKEMKELDRDSYNQEVIYQFYTQDSESNNYNVIPKANPIVIRSNEYEYDDENEKEGDESRDWNFNITLPVEFAESIINNTRIDIDTPQNLSTISNITNLLNTTLHESKGSFLSLNLGSLITVPITIFIFIRLYRL